MARLYLLLLTTACFLLDTCSLGAGDTEGDADSVFVTRQSALAVLRRQRRYNSGGFEELQKDNLERECREETCDMEEAREVFENDEKTMEFWVGYIDGNQCGSSPCQNGGSCKDGMQSYLCYCSPNFGGKNCEIEIGKDCFVNNGGCSHFCVMKEGHTVCLCAAGYRLGTDKSSCEPTGQFPCGHLTAPHVSRSVYMSQVPGRPWSSNVTSNVTQEDEVDMLEYDYFHWNDSDALNHTSVDVDVLSTDFTTSVPTEVVTNSSAIENSATNTSDQQEMSFWSFFPTVPSSEARPVRHKRRSISGNEAIPGEIPWHVTLMRLPLKQSVCGGSLLSELWVITAAHCLDKIKTFDQSFIVRAGEHDLNRDEGRERDHAVAERFIHPSYDARKSRYNHDIALLKLASPVELSSHRIPICLGPKDFTETLMRSAPDSVVSGWERAGRAPEASVLQRLHVWYVDRTQCIARSREPFTRFMFCTGHGRQHYGEQCQGDSGAPHATNHDGTWFLTGIASRRDECDEEGGRYSIYTRVSRYYTWIRQTTGLL